MANRKSRNSQGRGAALVRVEMRQTVAGPDGVHTVGDTCDLPRDVAESYIENRIAWLAEEQPSVLETAAAEPKYPGPWSKSELLAGIPIDSFVKWWSPERCQEISVNWVPLVDTAPMTFEEEQRDKLYDQAIKHLRHDLRRALESGWTFGRLPKDVKLEPELFSAAMQHEFIENVCLTPVAWCLFNHDGESITVRVYRSEDLGRSETVAPSVKAEKDCCRWLQECAAEPPQMAKPGYWQTASGKFKRLSRRGFDRAWANAVGDDPQWTRAGPKPKAPRT